VGMLNALPDTQLWRRLEREGRLLGEDASGNNTVSTLNFVTKMDAAKLIDGYQTIMKTIYKPREYYERVLDSLRRTVHETKEPSPYNLYQEMKALVRLILKLGILDGERKEFWRFFIQAVRKHHDRMTESLRLAAMGYHFRKLNELYDVVE